MDDIDRTLCRLLQEDGRSTITDLAQTVHLSVPATRDRIRKLEEQGIIGGYTALLHAERVGLSLHAFVSVILDRPEHIPAFVSRIGEMPAVLRAYHVTGEDSYLLEVRCPGTRELEALLTRELKELPGVLRTRTVMVLSALKETTVLPLGE